MKKPPTNLQWELFSEEFTVCRLPGDAPLPEVILRSEWYSLTRSDEELSLVAASDLVEEIRQHAVACESGWGMLRVKGVLDFSIVGLLANVLQLFAKHHVSVFVMSTFLTDYVLVKTETLSKAIDALIAEGHEVTERG